MLPVGKVGEIIIGGVGVSAGYLNLPEKTKVSFLDNLFGLNGRFYRSGDLGRWNENGEMECFGRSDDQVKIRGFRIELSEIESVICKVKGVKRSCVIVHGSDNLTGFFTPENISQNVVLEEISKSLPAYMVPQKLFAVSSIPLTLNGKSDKKKLESMFREDLATESSKSEETGDIVSIYEQVFGTSFASFGDYFKLGNSLLTMKFVNALNSHFQTNMTLKQFFELKSLKELRSWFDENRSSQFPEARKLEKLSRSPGQKYVLSHNQEQLLLSSMMSKNTAMYNVPLHVFLRGCSAERAQRAMNQLLSRHEIFRAKFFWTNEREEGYQLLSPHSPKAELKRLKTRDLASFAKCELLEPFDLQKLCVRCFVVELEGDADRCALIFTMHHLVCDGLSLEPLLKDLSSFLDDKNLPDLKFEYLDYAAKNKVSDFSDFLDQWQVTLKNCPMDSLHKPQKSKECSEFFFYDQINGSVVGAMNEICRVYNVTKNVVLMSALGAVLSSLDNASDFLLGTVSGNRNKYDTTENMVGYFVQTIPVRVNLKDNPTFAKLMENVSGELLSAMARESCPFFALVNRFDKEREATRPGLFQVFFSMIDFPTLDAFRHSTIQMEPLSEKPYPPCAKFELDLEATVKQDGTIELLWEFDGAKYDVDEVREISRRFHLFLETVFLRQPYLISQVPSFAVPVEQDLPLVPNDDDMQYSTVFQMNLKDKCASYNSLHVVIPCEVTAKEMAATLRSICKSVDVKVSIVIQEDPMLSSLDLEKKSKECLEACDSFHCFFSAMDDKNKVVFLTAFQDVMDRASLEILLDKMIKKDTSTSALCFNDYASWENRNFVGNRLRDGLFYYTKNYQSCMSFLDLPSSVHRTTEAFGAAQKSMKFELPKKHYEFFLRFKQNKAAAFSTAVAIVMGRHAINQNAFLFGMVHPNREAKGTSDIVGPLSNVIPLHVDLDQQQDTFTDILRSILIQTDENPFKSFPFDLIASVLGETLK